MLFLSEIAKVTNQKESLFKSDFKITELLIDSRLLISPSDTLFFALQTQRNNGHKFISKLYSEGVRAFVISETNFPTSNFPDAHFFLVENVLIALQNIASFYRNRFNIPVIGITGSNGKTIIKEWLKQMLTSNFQLVASPKSYNSQIGVPLSVWYLEEKHNLAIFEAGISMPNEMEKLEKIISPSIGILANIGTAHDEHFIDHQQKIEEKLKLFIHSKKIICNRDDKFVFENVLRFCNENGIELISWGKSSQNYVQILNIVYGDRTSKLLLKVDDRKIELKIPFTGKSFIENALHCFTLKLVCGLSLEEATDGFQKLQTIPLRLEFLEGQNNSLLINDSYNLDLESLREALQVLKNRSNHQFKTLIISDIKQSGVVGEKLYRNVAELIEKNGVKRLIAIGEEFEKYRSFFHLESSFFKTTNNFLNSLKGKRFHNEAILLKGAREFEFERIAKRLEQRKHETVLEVNLSALLNNLNYFRAKLPKNEKIMAMVKAYAYGSGSVEVAKILQYYGVDYLAVAYVDEGIELRDSGINLPIMVMNPEIDSFDTLLRYRLEPEIYCFRMLEAYQRAVSVFELPENKNHNFHIKLDTGMHRLGFMPQDISLLTDKLKELKNCRVKSIFSHLAVSDDTSEDNFTHSQIESFNKMSLQISKTLPYPVLKHIANSSAISRFPEAAKDMVRLGIGLYGVSTVASDRNKILTVSTLRTVVSQTREIEKGESVGYGRAFIAKRKTKVATIPIGYADGIMRSLSDKGSFLVNGKRAKIIGKVCMDMCMLDVTDMDVKSGDSVEIFGENNPIEKLAKDANTIPYEILAAISYRVKRLYIQE